MNNDIPTSDMKPIARLISRTRRLLRSSWVITGTAIVCAILLGTILAAAVADLMLTLWPSFRWVALALVVVPTLWAIATGVLRNLIRRLGSRSVARKIEEHIPKINNRLISCVDIADQREDIPLSEAFRQRLVDETEDRIRDFDPWQIPDLPRMRRAMYCAAAALLAFVITWLACIDRFPTAIARIFRPWADIPPVSGVKYVVQPGNAKALRGDPIEFAVDVLKGSPTDLKLEVFAKKGAVPLRYDLRKRDNRRWTFTLAGAEDSFDYRVIGGGTWTLPFHITILDRPKLVSLQATLFYPKYFESPEPRPNPPQVADVTGPEQSEVEVSVGTEGDIARGEIRLYQMENPPAAGDGKEPPKEPKEKTSATAARPRLIQTEAFPMRMTGKNAWTGRFPLLRDGYYRVHLENDLENGLKAANLTMKEGKLTAVQDKPPQISLERPTGDLTLSTPQKVPLVASVYDDFALAEIRIVAKKDNAATPTITTLKKYKGLVRNDTATLSFDLDPFEMKPGEQLHYHLEVSDRKGQIAATPEHAIRIAADDNAADRQLERFEKEQNQVQQDLEKLIEKQNKANEEMKRIEEKYKETAEKVRQAEAAAQTDPSKPDEEKTPKLDPETQKQLEEMRHELAKQSHAEERNAAESHQISDKMKHLNEQASQLQMMPPEMQAELRDVQKTFERAAEKPLKKMADEMRREAAAKQPDAPPASEWQRQGERVRQEMQAAAERLKAVEQARNALKNDADKALEALQKEMDRQQAAEAARELKSAQDTMAELQKELERLENHQDKALDESHEAHESQTPELTKKQESLEQQEAGPLAEAGELLQHERPRHMESDKHADQTQSDQNQAAQEKQNQNAQDQMDSSDKSGSEESKDAQGDESQNKEENGESGEKNDAQGEPQKAQKPPYQPALGGPTPPMDSKLAAKRPKLKAGATPTGKEKLEMREFGKLNELDSARQSLEADRKTLEKLLAQLPQSPESPEQADSQKSDAKNANAKQNAQAEQSLSELMQSAEMARAMELARRMEAAKAAARAQRLMANSHKSKTLAKGDPLLLGTRGTLSDEGQMERQLRELDPDTRGMLMKMPPRVREELLQGMREQGPEGYRQFIRDYFERLSKVDEQNKQP